MQNANLQSCEKPEKNFKFSIVKDRNLKRNSPMGTVDFFKVKINLHFPGLELGVF